MTQVINSQFANWDAPNRYRVATPTTANEDHINNMFFLQIIAIMIQKIITKDKIPQIIWATDGFAIVIKSYEIN